MANRPARPRSFDTRPTPHRPQPRQTARWTAIGAVMLVVVALGVDRVAVALEPPPMRAEYVAMPTWINYMQAHAERTKDLGNSVAMQRRVYDSIDGERQPTGRARTGLRLADDLMALHRVEQARPIYRHVAELAERRGMRDELAFSQIRLAEVALLDGRDRDALEWLQKAERVAVEQPAYTAYAKALLGNVMLGRGQTEAALSKLDEAFTIAKRIGDTEIIVMYCLALGEYLENTGDHAGTRKAFQLAFDNIGINRSAFAWRLRARVYLQQARFLWRQYEWDKAVDAIQAAFNSAQRGEDDRTIVLVLLETAKLYVEIAEFARAGRALQAADEHMRTAGVRDVTLSVQLRMWLARTAIAQGQLDRAGTLLQGALNVMGEDGHPRLKAEILRYRGELARSRGAYQAAIDLRREAAEISRSIGDTTGQMTALTEWGDVLALLGNHLAAAEIFSRAAALARQVGSRRELGKILIALARSTGDLDPLSEALTIATELNEIRQQAAIYLAIAEKYLELGDLTRAMTNVDEALRRTSERAIEPYVQGMLVKGRILLDRAIAAANPREKDDALGLAVRWFAACISFSRRAANQGLLAASLAAQGQAFRVQNRNDDALALFQSAAESLEKSRQTLAGSANKTALIAQNITVFSNIIDLLAAQSKTAEAFWWMESAKARTFLDQLAESQANIRVGVRPELLERERTLLQQITARQQIRMELQSADPPDAEKLRKIAEEIQSLENEFAQLKDTLKRDHPAYASLKYPTPAAVADVQRRLAPKQVLIAYAIGPVEAHAFALTKETMRYANLGHPDDFMWAVAYQRDLILSGTPIAMRELASNSYALGGRLLGPFADLIAAHPQLIIAADSALNYLPFETLFLEPAAADATSFKDLPYLISTVADVTYVQSATVFATLAAPREAEQAPEFLLALGDPVFPGEKDNATTLDRLTSALSTMFPRLPNTAREVRAIAGAADNRARALLRDDATEAALKRYAGSARYLHIATHGVLDEENPSFSGLLLSRAEGTDDDGFLYLVEIFNLRIRAELVVLSACETGLGRVVSGEGVEGLTRAFMYAGAPRLVVSLWSVDDASTATLMSSFYDSLWGHGGERTVTHSLAEAKRTMIASGDYASPYFWSPFIVVGSR